MPTTIVGSVAGGAAAVVRLAALTSTVAAHGSKWGRVLESVWKGERDWERTSERESV